MSDAEESVERRLTRRVAIPTTLVDVRFLDEPERRLPAFAVDVNADGIALSLPADVPAGARLSLTFQLDASHRFVAVGAQVLWNRGDAAGLRFREWSDEDRLSLIEYLDRRHSGA